jgi:hypothetical protein
MKKTILVLAFFVFIDCFTNAQWQKVNGGILDNTSVVALGINENNIYAGTSKIGVYMSNNHGDSWNEVNSGLPDNLNFFSTLTLKDNNLIAGFADFGVYVSVNSGSSWEAANTGLPVPPDLAIV